MKPQAKVVHISSWKEFKTLANQIHPTSISYTIRRSPLSKPPVGLRLVFAGQENQYVFLDFARGQALQKTKIRVHVDQAGDAYVSEEEIKDFIRTQLERTDLQIYSFEVLGY